jgi:hypothetical protein
MATFTERRASLNAQISHIDYETSEEVMARKIELSNELCRLLDNDTYEGVLDISGADVCIEAEFYDKYAEVYVDSCFHPVTRVCACEDGESYVEDEDGEEFYFTENLTLNEVEEIVNTVKDMLEELEE